VRDGSLLGLVVFDVDAFKAYNDTCGHPAGDDCLRRIGAAVEVLVRASGTGSPRGFDDALLARLGGEEFGVLLRDPPAGASETLAERLRAGIEALAIPHRGSPVAGVVTISLGVAVLAPQRDGTPHDIVALADAALYRAKQNGRNQVALAAPA
jgi:two-component system chemotaxis family response regulator WspR